MSLAELNELAEGADDRFRRQEELAAWQIANIVNVWLPRGKKISVRRLLAHRSRRRDRGEPQGEVATPGAPGWERFLEKFPPHFKPLPISPKQTKSDDSKAAS